MKLVLAFCATVLSTYVAQPSFAATIYVAHWNGGTNNSGVGEYDAATGAAINASFITGLSDPDGLVLSGNTLFLSDSALNTVGEYNATTGAAINADFISANDPNGLLISGNILYVTNFDIGVPGGGTIGTYDATTGATINANFITGLSGDNELALSGNTLYVAGTGTVGEYDATTGAAINRDFITESGSLSGLVLSGNTLFAADIMVAASCQGVCPSGTVGEYSATTGAAINGSLITGLGDPGEIALLGDNLFVSNWISGTVGEYDATTGAAINAIFITGLGDANGIAAASTPEPSTWFTIALGGVALFGAGRGRKAAFLQAATAK